MAALRAGHTVVIRSTGPRPWPHLHRTRRPHRVGHARGSHPGHHVKQRQRVLALAVLVCVVGAFAAYRVWDAQPEFPVGGPTPPSSVPATNPQLQAVALHLTPVAPIAEPTALA